MASGTTQGAGITDELRLKFVGAGWDINVTKITPEMIHNLSKVGDIVCMLGGFPWCLLT